MLEAKHLLDLQNSGLSNDTISKMGVYSVDGLALANGVLGMGNATGAWPAHAYAIPYFKNGNVSLTRYKVFWTEPLDSDGKSKPRYLSPTHKDWELYCPVGVDDLIESHDYVIVTEGEKKAAKAVEEGYPCVAIPGVTMWMDPTSNKLNKAMGRGLTYLTKPLSDLCLLAKNKKIIVMFDSDAGWDKNKDVARARIVLKDALLYHAGIWVRIVDIPVPDATKDKWGIDDVLMDSAGTQLFQKALLEATAKPSNTMTPLLKFAYSETSDGVPLHYEIPNTPSSQKYNIHQIIKEVEDKDDSESGRVARKKICSTRVWISRLVRSADGDDKTLYELAFIPLESREPKYLSGNADLIRMSRTVDDPLAEYGARVLSKEKAFLEEFLNDCQTYGVRAGKISTVWGTRRRGWVEQLGDLQEAGYVMANKVITLDNIYAAESRDIPLLPVDTGADGALKEALISKGTKEEWQAAVRSYVVPAPLPSLMLAASMAGLFRRWCPDSENFILHLYGESSHGKTTAMKAAASCWGNPDKMIDNWRSTDNGLERRCAARNDMVMFLDEAGMAVNEDIIKNSVYMIGNGGEKLRASRDATDRVTRRFQLVALSTGEKPLIRDAKFAGQEVRALELNVNVFGKTLWPTFSSGVDAEKFSAVMASNHGWAVEAVTKGMLGTLKKDPSGLHRVHQFLTQQLRDTLPPSTPAHIMRRVKHFGLLLTAWSFVLEYALDYTANECKELLHRLIREVASNALQLDTDQFKGGETDGILQHLVDQVTLNQSKFVKDGDADMPKGEIYGVIEGDILYAIPGPLNKLMAPFDNARLIALVDIIGALVYNKDKKKKDKKMTRRIGSMRPDCYVFDLKKIESFLGKAK